MTIHPAHYAKALYIATVSCSEKEAQQVIAAFAARLSAIGLGPLLPKILAAMPAAAREAERLHQVEIRTASSLTQKDIQHILDIMGLPVGQSEVYEVEDAQVVTGFRAATPDKVLDYSLPTRLAQLRQALTH